MQLHIANLATANKPWTQPWAEQLPDAQAALTTHSHALQKAILGGKDVADLAKAQANIDMLTAFASEGSVHI